jgi:ubiquinone/menaquinone biosynthesis C-methylase UbiE
VDYDTLAGPYAAHRRADKAVVAALRAGVEEAARVVEVGCGTGDHIGALHVATGCLAVGVDPSEEMLAVARARYEGVAFERGSAKRLPLPDASTELVFSVDVVHHLDDVSAACAEAFRVVTPGGHACTVTEDEAAIRARLHSRYFPETVAVELARYPTLAAVRAALTAAGFVDICEQRTESPYLVENARAYAEKAFSSLHLIGEDAHRRGLERLERDVPVAGVWRAVLVWARKP